MTDAAVVVSGLTKVFPVPFHREKVVAVRDLDLRVEAGEVYGLLGPNGSGKSTTLKIILGLVSPTRGRSEIFGRDSSRVDSREAVGFLPENPYFYKYLSGEETLGFFGKLGGLNGARLRQRIDELLELVGLTNARKRRLGTYSKGMLQRIGLAQALIHEPKLVVLDEPTAGVDPKARRDFWDEIHRLSGEGLTVLVSTHYMDEAERCDRIVYINLGSIVARGTVAEVVARSGLFTFIAEGEGARALAGELEGSPGVEFVAFFGTALHVSGRDRAALTKAMERLKGRPGLEIHEAPPSLEDVFIQLQDKNGDDPS
jgi:ABC-2 type transport system ATP-binding protein